LNRNDNDRTIIAKTKITTGLSAEKAEKSKTSSKAEASNGLL